MKQENGIIIVGLGPGRADLITRQVWQVLQAGRQVYVRTRRHPAVADLENDLGLTVQSFDQLYDSAETFAEVYTQIVEQVLELGRQGQVIYAVPGHPRMGESTVTAIEAAATAQSIPCQILAGVSFVEPCLSALGIDGLDGLQLHDAISLTDHAYPPARSDAPLLLGQVYSRELAGELKLVLMMLYSETHQVALVHAAGTEAQTIEWTPLYAIDRSQEIGHLTSLYVPPRSIPSSLEALADTVAVLRSPEGCPWDREQTSQSLRAGFLEEAAEVMEALDLGDEDLLREELGDLLFHIVIQAQIAWEAEAFSLSDVLEGIDSKLKRRHPHVWGDLNLANSDEVLLNWERLKATEKKERGDNDSLLDHIPPELPALAQSQKIQTRVGQVGFDWDEIAGVHAKLVEELEELRVASTAQEQFDEIGDVFFALVNLARWLDLDAESAAREANLRFARRFRKVESLARQRAIEISEANAASLLALWDEAKLA